MFLKSIELNERANSTAARIDEANGIIEGVKVLGAESANGRTYTPEAMRRALPMYEGCPVYIDHPPRDDSGRTRSYKDKLATLRRARVTEGAVYADLHVNMGHPVATWTRLLRGLWLSGLRLNEACELYWDRSDKIQVDASGRHIKLRIPARFSKKRKTEVVPIAPEFEEFLLATPEADRHGKVFPLVPLKLGVTELLTNQVGRVVSSIGKEAGVKVANSDQGDKVKYASAHDLRRSFGTRWARRVKAVVLQKLMRHSSINTTMKYYVSEDADDIAAACWEAVSLSGAGYTESYIDPEAADTSAREKVASAL